MIVKICGIQTLSAAHAAVEAGANWLGFVFAPSKRRITPEQAKAIVRTLPPSVQAIGVFVNETVETIKHTAEKVGLNMIQLHGDEPSHEAEQLPYPIIKAFAIDHLKDIDVSAYPSDYILIDSPRTSSYGGTGRSFDWHILQEMSLDLGNIILAGGLTCQNINQAIQITQPQGVDVSSGVETNGRKDNDKIRRFIYQAKNNKGVVEH